MKQIKINSDFKKLFGRFNIVFIILIVTFVTLVWFIDLFLLRLRTQKQTCCTFRCFGVMLRTSQTFRCVLLPGRSSARTTRTWPTSSRAGELVRIVLRRLDWTSSRVDSQHSGVFQHRKPCTFSLNCNWTAGGEAHGSVAVQLLRNRHPMKNRQIRTALVLMCFNRFKQSKKSQNKTLVCVIYSH